MTPGPCPECGRPVAGRMRGRPRVYCSRACQAKAYRARKKADGGDGAMSNRHAARRAAWHAAVAIEAALAAGWDTLDRYGPDRPRIEAALNDLCAELERRAQPSASRPYRAPVSGRDEDRESVMEPVPAVAPRRRTIPRDEKPSDVTQQSAPPRKRRPESPMSAGREGTRNAGTESARERDKREDRERWEQEAERERRQFEARLKPVAEFGEGYQMAEWPGTGRYYLVYEGERIGHATKKPFTTRWEAHTASGSTVPGSHTYGTRRAALVQVALHHQGATRTKTKRKRR